MDDPWDWDVDRVVQELCTTARSWHPSSTPLKLPPLGQLEEALRNNEVDGEVLLTYDQAELCSELGIKILKHKSTFKNAIRDIRLKSIRYRAYRKRQASELEDDEGDGEERVTQTPNLNQPKIERSTGSALDEQPSKKRRLAPTLIAAEIDPNRNREIATEADTVHFTRGIPTEDIKQDAVDHASVKLSTGAYLGNKYFTRFDIVNLDEYGHLEPLSEEDKQINMVAETRLVPGRMTQTHRVMKRWFLRGAARPRTRFTKSDMVPGSNNPEHDEVLPLYGDSDDDMEYDSDTWKEIEADKNSKQSRPKGLTVEEINSTLDRVLEQFISDWQKTKLPKYASKANRIWNDGKRFGLKDAIDRARKNLHEFEARIAKMKDTVQKTDYRDIGELERALSSFEPTVFDREHRSWLIGVLTSPFEPPKFNRPRELRERPSRPQPILADDEEVLTSDSESDLGDFIVNDDGLDDVTVADGDNRIEHTEDTNNDIAFPESDVVEPDVKLSGRAHPIPTLSGTSAPETSEKPPRTPAKPIQPVVIDLTTPPNPTTRIIRYKDGRLSSKLGTSQAKEKSPSSPLIMGITDLTSSEQKVANEMMTIDRPFIDAIFSIACQHAADDIWLDLIVLAFDREWPKAPYNSHIKKDGLTAYILVRLFETYKDDEVRKLSQYRKLDDVGKQRLRELYKLYPKEWDDFVRFLKRLSDRFEWTETELRKTKQDVSATPTLDEKITENADSLSDDTDANANSDTNVEGKTQTPGERKKKKKRRKQVVRNREAAMAREMDQAAAAERENRRKLLRERLETEGSTALGSQHGSIIVNESKGDDQGFIYINDKIARRIKDHQVTGVRFMWDQLVATESRQGCLLAHTMGLGKTMQVITLLVTIGQASASDDPTIFSQIPDEMRESRTLILCPATLVNNWLDEMRSWLPEGHELGDLFKVDAIQSTEQRNQTVQTWSDLGGVMIIGYTLFKAFIDDEDMREVFLKRPNIVIADEAHMMKNPKSKTHVAAANFRTVTRVALTGSPLANNVEEYFSMINWVAPNYLGDSREFRAQYANPIKMGLLADSTASDRRRALRMLHVLKSEVSPKVSRMTISTLKQDIPPKQEFVITVPLTLTQRQAYEMFIQHHSESPDSTKVPNFAIHHLNLICASPFVFLKKLEEESKNEKNHSRRSERVTLPQQLISKEMTLLRNAERGAKDEFTLSWKIPILLEILDQCKKLGDYVLLFSHSKVALDYLEGVLRMKRLSVLRLDGNTNMAERQNMVKRFNQGNIDIFLISTKAGALGLNITGANRVIIFDAQFNPQNEQQAVGRAYRIGQQKPVFVYRFVCGGTCEQKLLNQAIWKMQLASRIVDKKHPLRSAPRFTGAWDMPEEPQQMELDPFLGKDAVLDALLRNQKYREGIRAIAMMDIFEEEAIENAELSPEDVAMANQMIEANNYRRLGLPLPERLSAFLIASNGTTAPDNVVSLIQPSFASGSQPVPQAPHTKPPSASQPFLQHSLTGAPGAPGAPGVLITSTNFPNGLPTSPANPNATQMGHHHQAPSSGHSYHDPRQPSALPPVQLPGAEVHFRSPVGNLDGAPEFPNTNWGSLLAIQTDLKRAFFVGTSFPDQETRNQVGLEVSSAIWDNIHNIEPEQRSAMQWAVMRAVSSGRFIEALCMGLFSSQELGRMTPESIDKQVKSLKEVDSSEWETKKQSWNSRRPSGDPEHLQTALQRLSTAPSSKESDRQPDHNKSLRLDDHEALQAVFERRRLKSQQKDDQEALRAVMERRKATDSQSQSSATNNKEPRLPDWASKIVRQAQIPAPSSSVPPKTPSPTFSLRPQPKTPFK
ncbi:hypothetical protein NUW58_g4182 [Xylaria curta]|uniref:Uncharacterized protein n=1 Tax=Xylaria curta TaxID=42375 RepID=A0ACC1P8Z4_9PEZI|nr:hypothetical protein NUW58_g4182 [Xylaria curta]